MSAEPAEDKWKMNSHENDPAFSDERWTQFSKQSSTSPSKGATSSHQQPNNNQEEGSSSSSPKTGPEKLNAIQTHSIGTSVTPPATSPEAGVNGLNNGNGSPNLIPPTGATPLNPSSSAGTPSPPNGGTAAAPPSSAVAGGSAATILCQVGEAANGQPLLMAITPEQLAQCGGNLQLLLKGANVNNASPPANSSGNTATNTNTSSNNNTVAQPGTGPFTLSQQVLAQPNKATTPVAGGGLPTPMAHTPNTMQTSTPIAGGMAPPMQPPTAPPPQRTTNPQAVGLQMVVPPGMQIPIPVPASTMQVKSMVGTPKYQGVNQPQPSPGGPMGMLPFQPMPGMMPAGGMTPIGTTPQLLKMPGATTPGAIATPMVPMAGVPMNTLAGVTTPMQMTPGGTQAPKLSPMHGGGKPPVPGGEGGNIAEQAAWAAHSEQRSKDAPKLAEMRSMGSNSRSAEPTPQAGSVRGKTGGERSQGPTPQSRDGKKMSKQEMLLQQLSARDPASALPPKPAEEQLSDEEKKKRREELEQKLVGKKEDEAALATPMASGHSPASTPVAAWKAKPCKSFIQTGSCKYGDKCVFAHGPSVGAGTSPSSPTRAS